MPSASLATEKARALLPASYSREDVVANIQSTALLVAAFAQGRGDLLRTAMQDRIHQPYRMKACPLLPLLLPLADDLANLNPKIMSPKILGIALSGAGPSVLIITEDARSSALPAMIREAAGDQSLEVLQTTISTGALEGGHSSLSRRRD